MSEHVTETAEETVELGAEFARRLVGGDVVGIVGPLGAGKTEFVRGVARGLGVSGQISSPSYVLEIQYSLGRPEFKFFSHWDLYRLTDEHAPEELRDLGNDPSVVTVIEWPEKVSWIANLLKYRIGIAPTETKEAKNCNLRKISIEKAP